MSIALVTGATGGIGGACARLLVERGWDVIGLGRDDGKLSALRQDGCVPIRCDLAAASVQPVLDQIRCCLDAWEASRLDLVLHLAGNAFVSSRGEGDDARWDFVNSDLLGPALFLRQLVNEGMADATTRIGFIGSAAGGLGVVRWQRQYVAAKREVAAACVALRGQPFNRVTLISCGLVGGTRVWDRLPDPPFGRTVRVLAAIIPGPERWAAQIVDDVLAGADVAYPGLLARWAPVDDKGEYRPTVATRAATWAARGLGPLIRKRGE